MGHDQVVGQAQVFAKFVYVDASDIHRLILAQSVEIGLDRTRALHTLQIN
jgi:hypothetical protein